MNRLLIALVMTLGAVSAACATRADRSGNNDNATALRLNLERADLALREARLVDAEVLYRQLAISHPRLPDVWLQLGNIYARQAQLEAAMRSYKDGLEFNTRDGRLWHNLALIELRQSIHTLEIASELLPSDDPQRHQIEQLHRGLMSAGQPVP